MEKVTIEQIAKLADVSKATVSRVMNQTGGVSEKKLQRVQNVMKELDYRRNLVVRGSSAEHTKNIGVIVPEISKPFYARMIEQVEKYAFKKGYHILLASSQMSTEKEKERLMALAAMHVEGIILVSLAREAMPCHIRLKKDKMPLVLFDEKVEGLNYDVGVFIDNEFAVFNATDLLIKNQKSKVVFISGGEEQSVTRERLNGYRSALQLHGLPFDGRLIKYGRYSLRSGFRMVEELIQDQVEFDALIAGSDMVSIGAMQAFKHYHVKVPEEVQVIGFDNAQLGGMVDPGLTAIESPIPEMAREAVERLVDIIEKKESPVCRSIKLDTRIITRGSTKRDSSV